MTQTVINEGRDLKEIVMLKKDGYRLLSICNLGGRKETLQYSLINPNKSLIQHFLIDTFGKPITSLDTTYFNSKIFEREVNQPHPKPIIEESNINRKWNISSQLNSMNFTFNIGISNGLVENITVNPGFSYRTIERNLMMRDLNHIPNILAKIQFFGMEEINKLLFEKGREFLHD